MMRTEDRLNPDCRQEAVEAYDRIAPNYSSLVERRIRYLNRVDEIVISGIPAGSQSLLDVGAGDSRRGLKIAASGDLRVVVLVEPSREMQQQSTEVPQFVTLRAEELRELTGKFDVIVCLWNVLGHVFPETARGEALQQFARLAFPHGRIFVDIQHRYNAAHYGWIRTAARFLREPGKGSDVTVTWNLDGRQCQTPGHVFTDREFRALAGTAGLKVERRFVIDYETGSLRRYSLMGNLLYELSPRKHA